MLNSPFWKSFVLLMNVIFTLWALAYTMLMFYRGELFEGFVLLFLTEVWRNQVLAPEEVD